MGSSEKFCLRWNDFESNISVAFREIREEKDFFDCTLSCGSRQIQAHKLILSACSPFFRSILKQNPHQHPLLYLKGVQFNDLQAVLNFMYHGEVNVAQEELNSFLSVAEELQVKGLTQNPSDSNPKSEQPSPLIPRARPTSKESEATPAPNRPKPVAIVPSSRQPSYHPQQPGDIQKLVPIPVVKTEPEPSPYGNNSSVSPADKFGEHADLVDSMGTEVASMEDSYVEEGYEEDYGGYGGGGDGEGYSGQEYGGNITAGQKGQLCPSTSQPGSTDNIDENIIDDPLGQGFTCAFCGKGFGVRKHHCRRHIKNSHKKNETSLSCDICQKSYKNCDSLRHHQRMSHGLYQQPEWKI